MSHPSSAQYVAHSKPTRQCLPQLDQLPARFGLLDDTADNWSRFKHKIAKLNRDAPEGVSYKVFWIGRHGQGIREYLIKFHRELRTQSECMIDNVAKLKYGAEVRICRLCHVSCRLCAHRHGRSKLFTTPRSTYVQRRVSRKYAKINGDDEYVWGPDPLLTPLGEKQALDARRAWLNEMVSGIPAPETCFCSTLRRALDTWTCTFDCDDEKEKILATRKVIILEVRLSISRLFAIMSFITYSRTVVRNTE